MPPRSPASSGVSSAELPGKPCEAAADPGHSPGFPGDGAGRGSCPGGQGRVEGSCLGRLPVRVFLLRKGGGLAGPPAGDGAGAAGRERRCRPFSAQPGGFSAGAGVGLSALSRSLPQRKGRPAADDATGLDSPAALPGPELPGGRSSQPPQTEELRRPRLHPRWTDGGAPAGRLRSVRAPREQEPPPLPPSLPPPEATPPPPQEGPAGGGGRSAFSRSRCGRAASLGPWPGPGLAPGSLLGRALFSRGAPSEASSGLGRGLVRREAAGSRGASLSLSPSQARHGHAAPAPAAARAERRPRPGGPCGGPGAGGLSGELGAGGRHRGPLHAPQRHPQLHRLRRGPRDPRGSPCPGRAPRRAQLSLDRASGQQPAHAAAAGALAEIPQHPPAPAPPLRGHQHHRGQRAKLQVREEPQLYTIYLIQAGHYDGAPAVIARRYSDFERLHRHLRRHFGSDLTGLSFPRKRLRRNFAAETIAKRSRAFEQFLSHLHSLPEIRRSAEYLEFFYLHDLRGAQQLTCSGRYQEALLAWTNARRLQDKLGACRSGHFLLTLAGLAVCQQELTQFGAAHASCEQALQLLEAQDRHLLLVPFLQTHLHLAWMLGKNKGRVEAWLRDLQEAGRVELHPPSLKEVLLKHPLS